VNDLQVPIGSEIHREDAGISQLEKQVLAVPMRRFHTHALELPLQVFRRDGLENAGIAHRDMINRPAAASVATVRLKVSTSGNSGMSVFLGE
jgi:hypothetical protein